MAAITLSGTPSAATRRSPALSSSTPKALVMAAAYPAKGASAAGAAMGQAVSCSPDSVRLLPRRPSDVTIGTPARGNSRDVLQPTYRPGQWWLWIGRRVRFERCDRLGVYSFRVYYRAPPTRAPHALRIGVLRLVGPQCSNRDNPFAQPHSRTKRCDLPLQQLSDEATNAC
jgi:hypothetical protein